ncbi:MULTISPECIES: helix-turn-helix domain-containing protein [Hyphomonas]|uniref:winged helix-turn-helix transcriptional regulator n=1 Tax=Hyphomonas TaxID=85 RepID=UPI000C4D7E94|nr:transcriptional regulator [Hyphomonas sp.]
MDRNSAQCRSHCPINFVLETFGDKWTLLIVRDLMFKGKSTFLEFAQSDEGISTNILSDRLKRLETHGIVSKETSPDNRSSLIYSLTDRGKDLLPIMVEITAWSAKHDELTNTPDEFLSAYKNDRSGLISSFRKPLDDD